MTTEPVDPDGRGSIGTLLVDAIDALAEGFMLFDGADRLVAVNSRYLELYDLEPGEYVPGTLWRELLERNVSVGRYRQATGREAEYIAERVAMRLDPGGSFEIELDNGRWLRATDRRTRDGGMVSIRADITQQKLAERRLRDMQQAARESEARLAEIVEANPLPMIITRISDGVIVYANLQAAEMMRMPVEALTGSRAADHYAEPRMREVVLKAVREGGRIDLLEMQFRRPDGTVFPLAMVGRPITYRWQACIVTGLQDLSDWRRLQQALHQSEKLSAMSSLLAGVAHELNNPLSIVLAQAALLEEMAADDGVRARADRILAAAERCSRIVRSFLAIARERPPEHRAVALAEVIRSALDITAYGLRSSGIEVELDLPPDLPPARGDADQLSQVFMNLVVNAQQALQEVDGPRRLAIAGRRRDGGRVQVTVRDTGPGVPAAIRSRVFDPFFTSKPVGSGTGIGLSVCLGIVAAHGGTLELHDEGPGATFVLTLPEAVREAGVAAPPPTAPAASPDDRAILIVDDEADIAAMLAEILRPLAGRIDVASSGAGALAYLGERAYDVIVSDVRMPELDGPGLFRRLQEAGGGLERRMLFVTGDTLHQGLQRFLRGSGVPVLEKPFQPAEVRRRVAQMLQGGGPAG